MPRSDGVGSASGAGEPGPPAIGRAVAALVALQTIALVGVSGAILAGVGQHHGLTSGAVVSAVFFLLLAGCLGLLARGWAAGRRWARTPTGLVQVLLLPIGITAGFQARDYAIGVPVLVVAVVTLALVVLAAVRDPTAR